MQSHDIMQAMWIQVLEDCLHGETPRETQEPDIQDPGGVCSVTIGRVEMNSMWSNNG